MRILVVAHFKPMMHYGVMQKLVHALVRLGHVVQLFDDRATARQATWFHSRKWGIAPMNKRLLDAAAAFQPDLVLIGHAEMVWNSTLEQIRRQRPAVKIAYRNVDWLLATQNVSNIHTRAKVVDMIFSTTAGEALRQFSGKRARIAYIPNPVDKAIDCGQAFAYTDQPYDGFYAIGGVYAGDPRPAFIEAVRSRCPEAKLDVYGMNGRPPLSGQQYLDALQGARMGFNYSRDNGIYLYSSDRMAQYMGNGLLAFQDRASGFNQIFREEEMAFYDSVDELAEKFKGYCADDALRQRHAQAGWQRIHAVFASEKVAQYMLECIFERPFSQSYCWPVDIY